MCFVGGGVLIFPTISILRVDGANRHLRYIIPEWQKSPSTASLRYVYGMYIFHICML